MSTRSLTQTEAEQRAKLIEVVRYDVEVDLTDVPTGPEVRAVSTVSFTCREPGAESFVDCAADVVSATLNGVPLAPASEGRIALTDLAEHNVLRVESVQAETTTGEGVHKATDQADGEVYLWMSFEPDEARHVWACFDQPDLKAPHAFTVIAPLEWTVLSNSGDPQIEVLDSARRWSFPDTPRLSTYNLVINAGPLHEIRREARGYDLGIFARRSLASILERDADEIFTVTEQGLAFFGGVFKMPFPQRKYDQVFMPEMGGAMENFGCVTWSDAFLRRTPPTPAERELLAKVLLHEMAHMWFGNIVTMRWWDDLWLNEAYAEFAAQWAAERSTAYTDAWAGHLAAGKLAAYLADQGPTSHPIRQPIHDVAQAASIFDAITYPKGASVLQQLKTYVGEAEFSSGMASYFAQHAWGNTTLQDLIDALAATSGRDLDRWREGWLETAGTDRLTLERGAAGLVLVGRGPDGDPRPQVLAVGAYRKQGDGLERTALAQVEVQGARTPVDLPTDADLYLVNDDDLTFATARPDAGTRDGFFATAAGLPTPISRGVAVATVWDMLVSGEATAAEVVTCMTGVLAAETSGSVIEPYLQIAGDVAELWASDVDRARLLAGVAEVCRHLASDESRRQVALRTLARTAPDLEAVSWLQVEAPDDVDLQWRALVRKAELGAETGDEVQRLLEKDPDPDSWVRAIAVQAAAPDAGEKASAWQTLVVDRKVPIGSFNAVATAFWRPAQDDLLAPYAEQYLELLPELDKGGMIPAMVYTNRLFPVFGVGEDFIARALDVAQGAAPVVRKVVTERADVVRRMLGSRA
jgi:aminopeptidase N